MLGLLGSMATEPIASDARSSNSGVQLTPSFVVFHTPPLEVPMYAVRASVGCVAMAVTRPEYGSDPPHVHHSRVPLTSTAAELIGCGPSSVQFNGDAANAEASLSA